MDFKKLSKKKRVYLIIFCVIAMILAWAFITARVITHDFNRKMIEGKQDEQQAVVNGVILTETKDDLKFWEIYGETGKWDSSNGIAQLNNVLANFYKDNEVSMSLRSSKGTYDSKTKIITLYEKTHVVIQDGITLDADKLTYESSDKPIVAQGHVKIQKGSEFTSTADKIVISPSYDNFKIIGNTNSKVYEDKK